MSIIDLNKETIQKLTPDSGIENLAVTSSLQDIDGSMWLSSSVGKIENIDLGKGIYKRLIDPDSIIQKSRKDRMIQTEKNIIWVADGNFGLHKIDTDKNLRWRFSTENGLISNLLYSIVKDHKNHIWIATDKGVQMIDEKELKITTFTVEEGLGASDVYDVIEQNDKIYLGTSKGLTILETVARESLLFGK